LQASPPLELIGVLSEKQLNIGDGTTDIVGAYRQDFEKPGVKSLQEQMARDFQGGMEVTVNGQRVSDVPSYRAEMETQGASPDAIENSLYLLHQGIAGPACSAVTTRLLPEHTLSGEGLRLKVTVRNQEVVLEAEAKYDVCRMPNDTDTNLRLQEVGKVALVTRVGDLGCASRKAVLVEVHADELGAQVVQPLLPHK
jgi:hypothetical protein